MKKAVVIIPTYNEKENIQIVVPKLLSVFEKIPDWDLHILVVDDTSPDKTYEVVKKLSKKYTHVHLLINPQKSGLGGAYLKGMAQAFGPLKADVIFEFDADLSHDPEKIPAFLQKIDEGYDLVLGSRYIPGGSIPADWGVHRKFLSVVGNIVIMIVLTDFHIRDWTTGYRAITKNVYETVLPFVKSERFTGYTFQIGFLYTAVRQGFKVAEVPFHFIDRTVGKSKLGMEYIKNTLLYIFRVRASEIYHSRFFKFASVGAFGAIVQFIALTILRAFLPYQLAFFLSVETAVVSNFLINNIWTFADRKLSGLDFISKFPAFNLASAGSIAIQQACAMIGEFAIGLIEIFRLGQLSIDTGYVYAVVGIGIGMIWNYFAYTLFVWKKEQ